MSITKRRTEGSRERGRQNIGGKLLPTLCWGESETSERLMSATVELSMKDKNICKLRHIARGINALRILPCNLEEFMWLSLQVPNLSTMSTHFIFILSLTHINRVYFGRAYLCILLIITFCNYVAPLDVIQGRSPLTPANTEKNTKYIATQFYLLYLYVFFIFRHTERSFFFFFFGFWHKLSGLFLDKLCTIRNSFFFLLYLAQYIPPQITKLITEYETIRLHEFSECVTGQAVFIISSYCECESYGVHMCASI